MREKKRCDGFGLVLAAEVAAASASDRHRFYGVGAGVSLTVSIYSRIYELPRFALVVFFTYLPQKKVAAFPTCPTF